ncbi:hypothetical protein LAV73_12280 [Lysinibacillus xylanilyticus]|uniref:hypothetical protein n=1 Tax=Lysinibacillus xylanilyticus TaxID=582475 RepID=UPI002B241128|nr:hypothetical protein [Lysinibacillus xylanilyticus]MEB2280772.1 hypothetical protein [Lysinibacillus xylanilyticus]
MDIFIFILVLLLVFTGLAIERILKDIREQNKEIIDILKKNNRDKEDNTSE